jgi:hypothetical protein
MEMIYRAITSKLTHRFTHEDFLGRWAQGEAGGDYGDSDNLLRYTRTANGENPMLSWYKNASIMVTH